MPTQVIEREGVRFDELDSSARRYALDVLAQRAYESLEWEELQYELLEDLEQLGLKGVKLENVAPDDLRYGRDAVLSGSFTLSELMMMRDIGAEEYKNCLITHDLIAHHTPLVFELMVASGDTLHVELSPNHQNYSTAVTLGDEQVLSEYLEWKYFEDLRLDSESEAAEEIRDDLQGRLNDELDELEALLQSSVDSLCRGLHTSFTRSIDDRCRDEGLMDSPWVTEGLFTPEGKFLDYDYS